MMKLTPKSSWTAGLVDEVKAAVRTELEACLQNGGVEARRQAILAGIRAHAKAETPAGQLQLYVFVVSALVHHERYGGFTTAEINRFVTLAHAVLKYQGVQPETSKLGFLYGELHLALSQIHRRQGEHWLASWEQQMALHLARRSPPGGEAFQQLSVAIRALRLGHGARALQAFTAAEAGSFEKARIGTIRCLRLTGQAEAARERIQATLALATLSDRCRTEVCWEEICLRAGQTGDLAPMMASVQRGGPHYEAVYIVEAFFWAHAVRELQYVGRLPKMQTLARKKELQPGELGFFLKAALQFEACHDQAVPYTTRLRSLGQILGGVNELVSIDRELLLQLAATRWLARQHATTLAATTLCEYQGICLKLSSGQTGDVFGVAGDLFERSWFVHAGKGDAA